jgi:hypothetical protein
MLDETGMGPVMIQWEGAGVVYPVGLENRLSPAAPPKLMVASSDGQHGWGSCVSPLTMARPGDCDDCDVLNVTRSSRDKLG